MNENCCKEKYTDDFLKVTNGISGFTLVELMIAMAVGLVILGAIYGIFVSENKQINKQDKIVEMQQNVRAAMDTMSREVRMAGYNPTKATTIVGITYNTAELKIQSDLNGDGDASDDNETITYAFDDTNKKITRKIGNGTAVDLAESIATFTFSYLNGAGGTTTSSADIRQVRITITGRTSVPVMGQYPEYTLKADVYARNLAF